jgi:lipoprotein-anchoring transpeptidase ErfK/SrfK
MSLALVLTVALLQASGAHAQPKSHRPRQAPKAKAAAPARPDALPTQVMLDRAGFSPGVIDGRPGKNTDKAMAAYKQSTPDAGGDAQPALPQVEPVTQYTVTQEDADGPYAPDLPSDMMALAKLEAASYRTPLEALAERFHATPALLQRLNPNARFAAGDVISVPNVTPLVIPVERLKTAAEPAAKASPAPAPRAAASRGGPDRSAAQRQASDLMARPDVVVTVSKSTSSLNVQDAGGKTIFYAPVTTGSEHDPLPIGEWKVKGTQLNPTFRYNPGLFWDADPTHTKAVVPAGPNNPVGVVWIDLSKEHYGIHGTPEPSAVGRAESHGCVRLTNWDAMKLASLVKPGTRVVFSE